MRRAEQRAAATTVRGSLPSGRTMCCGLDAARCRIRSRIFMREGYGGALRIANVRYALACRDATNQADDEQRSSQLQSAWLVEARQAKGYRTQNSTILPVCLDN